MLERWIARNVRHIVITERFGSMATGFGSVVIVVILIRVREMISGIRKILCIY